MLLLNNKCAVETPWKISDRAKQHSKQHEDQRLSNLHSTKITMLREKGDKKLTRRNNSN